MEKDTSHISPEQQRYAFLLLIGSRLGLAILVASFLAYVFGLIPAHVPLDQMAQLWSLPLNEYLQKTNTPTGWHWLSLANKGDIANLIGIAILCGSSLICLLSVIPTYARRGDKVYVALCILAIAVQLLAASGILSVGH
ncbi:MAG: hypothetical protein PHV02_06555 [Rhodocyclaceae bacterium]|nr:hypothetical protein [Rhodocyclaceae bacterium]